ncbi:NAD-dependent epimerase/dehydratase family protein [Crocinitomix algicola]|uniref:NAD-dependent epimerase/dehydratase family protein n=1 Tax=Crocinitomix algicola TaxID=1740263 RepID=UPI000871C7CC|nr:NAD-dependent epimerase/dehydratase family protein [Crocinitomix algicola]
MLTRIAILGLGWLGLPLAHKLQNSGYNIIGSTRTSEKLMGLLQSPFAVRIIDFQKDAIKGDLTAFLDQRDCLIITVPPSKMGESEQDYEEALYKIVLHAPDDMHVIFISSTSVYGDATGEITEDTIPNPQKKSANILFAAERFLYDKFKEHLTIVRLGGLYGPSRHPGNFYGEDRKIPDPKGVINFIHQDDAIQLLLLILEQGKFGELFNGVAPSHPKRDEFYKNAARDLGLPVPSFEDDSNTPPRIISGQRAINELNMTFKHPNPADF